MQQPIPIDSLTVHNIPDDDTDYPGLKNLFILVQRNSLQQVVSILSLQAHTSLAKVSVRRLCRVGLGVSIQPIESLSGSQQPHVIPFMDRRLDLSPLTPSLPPPIGVNLSLTLAAGSQLIFPSRHCEAWFPYSHHQSATRKS